MQKFRASIGAAVVVISFSAFTGCGVSNNGTQRATDATTVAASASPLDSSRLDVAPRLSMEISSSARTSKTTSYSDGRKAVSYDVESDDSPYTVIVEYYESGKKSATEVFNTEKQALSADGAKFREGEFSLKNAHNSHRLDWDQDATVPWSSEDSPPSIPLKCSAVFFDGAEGYSYAVYVSGDARNNASLEQVQSLLESIVLA
jgi:lipoprotein